MLKCSFASPLQKKVEDGVISITIETVTGQRGILTRHMPIVTQLKNGSKVRLQKEMGSTTYVIGKSGFFKFLNDEGLVLSTDFSEHTEY